MAESNIGKHEFSVQEGEPIECYKFTSGELSYLYTSNATNVNLVFNDAEGNRHTESFYADVISRDNIKPSSLGDSTSCTCTVARDNNVALLFQGAPPEVPTNVVIYRFHQPDNTKCDVVFNGRVSQVTFSGSKCELTLTMENYLKKEVPNGMQQYYCNNMIFDKNCRLKKEEWEARLVVGYVDGLYVFSEALRDYKNDYFLGGVISFGGYVRTIAEQEDNYIKLKYPMLAMPRNIISLYPGCDHLFRTCVEKFNNHLNFTGCPYIPPTDSAKNPVGKGMYWIDDQVVWRDSDGAVGTIEV